MQNDTLAKWGGMSRRAVNAAGTRYYKDISYFFFHVTREGPLEFGRGDLSSQTCIRGHFANVSFCLYFSSRLYRANFTLYTPPFRLTNSGAPLNIKLNFRAFTTHYVPSDGRPLFRVENSLPAVLGDLFGDDLTQSNVALAWLRHNVKRFNVVP